MTYVPESLCLLIPFTFFLSPASPALWQLPIFLLYIYKSVSVLFIYLFRFHIKVKLYSICLCPSDLFHNTLSSIRVVTNGKISLFFRLNNILLCVYIYIYICIYIYVYIYYIFFIHSSIDKHLLIAFISCQL